VRLRAVELIAFASLAAAQRAPLPLPASGAGVVREVSRRLRSTDPADLAWGGYLAAENRVHEAEGWLRRALLRTRSRTSEAHDLAALALLDALIRIGATVPAHELGPYLRGDTIEAVIILLARSPRAAGPILLAFLREADRATPAWLAAGNVLAQHPTAGFAAIVLEQLQLDVDIMVEDPTAPRGEFPFSGRGGTSCGGGHIPEGFPPIAAWVFISEARGGALRIAAGRFPVWAVRRLVRTSRGWPCRWGIVNDEHEVRVGWLATLLGDERPAIERRVRHRLAWTSPQACREQIVAWRAACAAAWRDVRNRLLERGHLSREECERLRPRLSVIVRDRRQDRSTPLPSIAGVQHD
jgi:hypothetical protein